MKNEASRVMPFIDGNGVPLQRCEGERVMPFVDGNGIPLQNPTDSLMREPQAFPAYPTGSITKVVNSAGTDQSAKTSDYFIIYDVDSMHLVKHTNGKNTSHNEIYTNFNIVADNISDSVKFKTSDKCDLFCTGRINVFSKEKQLGEDGRMQELIKLEIKPANGKAVYEYIKADEINNVKLIRSIGERNGVIFHIPDKMSYLIKLFRQESAQLDIVTVRRGFYFDNTGIHHEMQQEINASVLEAVDCKNYLRQGSDNINLPLSALHLVDSFSRTKTVFHWMKFNVNPIIVMQCSNIDSVKNNLRNEFSDVPQIALGKEMERNLQEVSGGMAFIIANSGSTSYFANKLIEIIEKSGSQGASTITCVPVVITNSDNLFKQDCDRIIRINYQSNSLDSICRPSDWFMKQLISKNGLTVYSQLKNGCKLFMKVLDSDPRLNEISATLFAILLSIFGLYLSRWSLDDKDRAKLLSEMREYLTAANEGGQGSILEMIKGILNGELDIPVWTRTKCRSITENGIVLVDTNMTCFDNIGFKKLSQLCGFEKPRNLAEALQKEDLLLTDGKLQKKVSLPAMRKSENLYCINNKLLFRFGETLPETQDFAAALPEVQLYLGRTESDKPVYFTISKTDGSQNANVYVSGTSGCGKSTLLRQWARQSCEMGLETVIIDTDGQFVRNFDDEAVRVYSIGKEYSISSSGKCRVLLAAADALDGISTKQKNELRELCSIMNNCKSTKDLLERFCNYIIDREINSLVELSIAISGSKLLNLDCLNWNDICKTGAVSILDLSSLDDVDLKPILDLLLEEFYEYKKARQDSGVTTCSLILDEVQNFRLDGKSPLASLILRQGRKYGISTVMATQYLSSDDAMNVGKLINQCESICTFRPSKVSDSLRIMNLSKNEEAELCITGLEVGELLAVGLFSTDKCNIHYPVKFTVINDN